MRVTQTHADTVRVTQTHADTVRVTQTHADTVRVTQTHADTVRVTQTHADTVRVVRPLKHIYVRMEHFYVPHCTNTNRGQSSSDLCPESYLVPEGSRLMKQMKLLVSRPCTCKMQPVIVCCWTPCNLMRCVELHRSEH